MGSVFGNLFRISTFGESHGGGVGVVAAEVGSDHAKDYRSDRDEPEGDHRPPSRRLLILGFHLRLGVGVNRHGSKIPAAEVYHRPP